METEIYDFVGYDAYFKVLPAIRRSLASLEDENRSYEWGIGEAVKNAARYSLAGEGTVPIHIEILRTDYDIITKISAPTRKFDAVSFRNSLRSLAMRDEWRGKEWMDYVRETGGPRGFWLMLMGCDYLYVRHDGQEISLCSRVPFAVEQATSKMGLLAERFLIEKNGVIL